MEREALYAAHRRPHRRDARGRRRAKKCRRRTSTARHATARKALGFEELLHGDVEAMSASTRRYAKRQLTWLRKLPNTHLIDMTDRTPEDAAAELEGRI